MRACPPPRAPRPTPYHGVGEPRPSPRTAASATAVEPTPRHTSAERLAAGAALRIGFNFFPYSRGKHGGAEVYLTQIVREILAGDHGHTIVLAGEPDVLEQFDGRRGVVEKVAIPAFARRGRALRIAAEQTVMPWVAARRRLDWLVSNYVIPLAAPCRHAVIVHDMIYRRFPETLEPLKRLFWSAAIPLSLWRSARVMTVSRFSAREIAALHPEASDKIRVTVEGVRPSLAAVGAAVRPDWLGNGPYLVSVATFGRHKNLRLLVEAFGTIAREHDELSLVIVGAARTPDAVAQRDELTGLAARDGSAGRIRFADHVTDAQLAWLYANAEALVLPSLYEGFGLPVIEAQRFGCPVVCANRAALPEVAGQGGLVFDPDQPQALVGAVRRLLADGALRERLRRAARTNVERFSWARAAEQLLSTVEGAS